MEALIGLLFTNITKFMNYLNINPRLQNKIFTVISIFPTLYILRIVKGYFQNQNYVRGCLYLIIFIVLAYFIVVNFVYYFKNKKVKWDVTNLIEGIVPEDATFEGDPLLTQSTKAEINGYNLPLDFFEDSDIIIEEIIQQLIDKGVINTNDLSTFDYLVDKYTLIPFYKIRQDTLWIGSSYSDMREVAHIQLDEDQENLIPLGVFILGGTYQQDGIVYKEPYRIQLRVKHPIKKETHETV
ncbi:MAG: DUF6681 family protein [Vagococcus sp.]